MLNYEVNGWKDVAPVCEAINEGMPRIEECPNVFLEFKGTDGNGYEFYGMRGSEDIRLYVGRAHLCDVLERINAQVSYRDQRISMVIDQNGVRVNGGKLKKYKRQGDMTYRLQKTQWKGSSPYNLLQCLLDDLFYYCTVYGIEAAWLGMPENAA